MGARFTAHVGPHPRKTFRSEGDRAAYERGYREWPDLKPAPGTPEEQGFNDREHDDLDWQKRDQLRADERRERLRYGDQP